MASSAVSTEDPTVAVPSRLGQGHPHTNQALDVIGVGFAPHPCTSFFLGDAERDGVRFWTSMSREILEMLRPGAQPLYALPSASEPEGVAFAYVWRPGAVLFNIPKTEAMVQAAVQAPWDASGDLWHRLMLDVYAAHGPFVNIDFIAVRPERARAGLGRQLLGAILREADAGCLATLAQGLEQPGPAGPEGANAAGGGSTAATGQEGGSPAAGGGGAGAEAEGGAAGCRGLAVFLAASSPDSEAWYGRHGFQVLHRFHERVAGVPGSYYLTFMVRPPRGASGGWNAVAA
ncbi:hypothetical protein HYH03_000550 [Edaphochlamys debaryana]|uniref:N-acetyltransferase domain-containing protein n=1 Tax=Edaphochlamys debaryana TaxID=47281 RepID=A0A835YJE9_9CHLO|nr:hypothetical protein HYH03_000550 [Edaphochlamys debaryana]|eukprot:KAG2502056.1 hypothetical protein HYH03_000550 [Edaphochlamys debaryana]